jgi:hypothetical protein
MSTDRRVTHPYPEWSDLHPDFKYHGHNVYSYLQAKYGKTTVERTTGIEIKVSKWVILYEGCSHVQYKTQILKFKPIDI